MSFDPYFNKCIGYVLLNYSLFSVSIYSINIGKFVTSSIGASYFQAMFFGFVYNIDCSGRSRNNNYVLCGHLCLCSSIFKSTISHQLSELSKIKAFSHNKFTNAISFHPSSSSHVTAFSSAVHAQSVDHPIAKTRPTASSSKTSSSSQPCGDAPSYETAGPAPKNDQQASQSPFCWLRTRTRSSRADFRMLHHTTITTHRRSSCQIGDHFCCWCNKMAFIAPVRCLAWLRPRLPKCFGASAISTLAAVPHYC